MFHVYQFHESSVNYIICIVTDKRLAMRKIIRDKYM